VIGLPPALSQYPTACLTSYSLLIVSSIVARAGILVSHIFQP